MRRSCCDNSITKLVQARIAREGHHVAIVSYAYAMAIEALLAEKDIECLYRPNADKVERALRNLLSY
jgi:hypothetical protein